MLALPQEARGDATVDLVWTATSGVGTTGSNSIEAASGDVLTAEVRVTAGPEGISGSVISLQFDTALDDELDLLGAGENCTVATCGGLSPITPGVAVTQESTLLQEGYVAQYEAFTFDTGPVNTTYVLGTVVFQVNDIATDGNDVFSGVAEFGDGIQDNFFNLVNTTFNNAAVNAVPVPSGRMFFDGLTHLDLLASPYQEDGLQLSEIPCGGPGPNLRVRGDIPGDPPGIQGTANPCVVRLERIDAAPFDFVSVAAISSIERSKTFTGFRVGGATVVHTVTLSADFNDMETFVFPATFRNLERVEVDIANAFWDDFITADTALQVPALEAGGLVTVSALLSAIGVGLLRRKRSS